MIPESTLVSPERDLWIRAASPSLCGKGGKKQKTNTFTTFPEQKQIFHISRHTNEQKHH